MQDLNELLIALEDKFGYVTVDIQNANGCSACIYDDDCNSCKGNAMGN